MKVSRLFTIDVELAEKLKQMPNQSAYVNQILKESLSLSSKKSDIIEQKQAIYSNFKKKMREIRREIKIFSEFEEIGLDNFAIRWIKGQQTEPGFWTIKEYLKGRELKITEQQILKAYKIIKENGNLFEKY